MGPNSEALLFFPAQEKKDDVYGNSWHVSWKKREEKENDPVKNSTNISLVKIII